MIAHAPTYPASARLAAEVFRPEEDLKASEWAERHRNLKPGTTPSPGRWRNSYLPWLAPILDAWGDELWADGWAFMKPAQVAGSELGITLFGYLAHCHPGPMLYLCSSIPQARKFSLHRFEHMIDSADVLRDRFLRGKRNHETILDKTFAGGSLIIAGAGSAGQMLSNPARFVFLDEEDLLGDFPGLGNARSIAEKRTNEYGTRVRCGIFSWAHPTYRERGIGLTYHQKSDQREWCLPCPHCLELIVPNFAHVVIPDRDPSRATWTCQLCGSEISDQQRWRQTRRGRFVSQLGEAAKGNRRFVGFHVSKLCHPRTTLFEIAQEYVEATSEAMIQVFWNMTMGLPYTPAAYVITEEAIRAKIEDANRDRTAPEDTRFVTVGVDVQKGREDVVLYYCATAWTMIGNAHHLEFGRLLGWAALLSLLRTFRVTIGKGTIGVDVAAIDHGWKTRQVYDFCRAGVPGVPWVIPVKHEPGITPSDPTVAWRGKNPVHPELGLQTRWKLCRDYWMDRALGRLSPLADPDIGGACVLPLGLGPEVISHLKAAYRMERTDVHGFTRITWDKEKGARDDWLQAAVYAEVAAVLNGLDKVEQAVPARPQDAEPAIREGHAKRSASTTDRYIGGRRSRDKGPYR